MQKILFSFLLLLGLCASAFAQKTPTVPAIETIQSEIRSSLISKLGITEEVAGKIISVEENFYAKLDAIETQHLPVKEKETKLNEAHTARRTALLAAPLTGRQMEDAIEVVAAVRRKHKG